MAILSSDWLVAELLERPGWTYADELGIALDRGTPSALFGWLCASILLSARIRADIAVKAARARRSWLDDGAEDGPVGLATAPQGAERGWLCPV